MQSFRALLTLLLFAIQTRAFPAFDKISRRADQACNGYAQLCSRRYSDVIFVGTHDSAFVGALPSQNQEKSLKDQLGGGIRFLQSQMHVLDLPPEPAMCHTNCAIPGAYGGLVSDYLKTVKTFLDQNPREVVTLLLTIPEQGDRDMSKLDAIYKSVGLDKMAFVPSSSPNPLPMDQWPTLSEMIDRNQRFVTFIDYGADETKVPYLLDEFNYFWETPFDVTDATKFTCDMDRRNKVNSDGKTSMIVINHVLDMVVDPLDLSDLFKTGPITVPDRDAAATTNALTGGSSIIAQADQCKGPYGRYPNVVLIDFFGRGDAIGAQKMLNGLVSAVTRRWLASS